MSHINYGTLSNLWNSNETPSLFVFDHKVSSLYTRLAWLANRKGIPTVAVPHGPGFGASFASSEGKLRSGAKMPYQHIFASNEIQGQRLSVQNKQLSILGSARFSIEWIRVIHQRIPDFKFDVNDETRLKVVVMAKKPQSNFNTTAMKNLLVRIASTPNVHLVIKSHPRDRLRGEVVAENVREVGAEVASSALIRWADLVLFTHSSIALEAVQLDKPVIYLKFLVEDHPTHERSNIEWGVESLPELIKLLEKMQAGESIQTYSPRSRRMLISNFIAPYNENVLANYQKRFLEIMSASSKDKPSLA